MKQVLALIGALCAAVAASACCILPVVLGAGALGSLGVSAALQPFRPALIGLTLLLLGAAFYFTYRPAKTVCDADGNCVSGKAASRRSHKIMLWAVAAMTVAAMAYPPLAALRARAVAGQFTADDAPINAAVVPARSIKTVVFTIDKMTCAECTIGIADALEKTSGVQKAGVDFKTKQATVRYDAARVGVPQLRSAIERAGFPAQEKRP